jgi:hypothetical protein
MKMGWILFLLLFWPIIIHWIVLMLMGKINGLRNMMEWGKTPTIVCIFSFILVGWHTLQCVKILFFDSSLLFSIITAEHLDHNCK